LDEWQPPNTLTNCLGPRRKVGHGCHLTSDASFLLQYTCGAIDILSAKTHARKCETAQGLQGLVRTTYPANLLPTILHSTPHTPTIRTRDQTGKTRGATEASPPGPDWPNRMGKHGNKHGHPSTGTPFLWP
jgi:hypothetical protein